MIKHDTLRIQTPPDRVGLMVETSHPQVIGLDRGNAFLRTYKRILRYVNRVCFCCWQTYHLKETTKNRINPWMRFSGDINILFCSMLNHHDKSLGLSPFPVIVTTRIITFLLGNPYKPSFPLLLGRGTTQQITNLGEYALPFPSIKQANPRINSFFCPPQDSSSSAP